MSGFVRHSERIRLLIARAVLAGAMLCGAAAHAADPPARVVSVNLCTDQLAMLLAREGQLLSVSHLAVDPRSSAMVAEAREYRTNHGLAEEIYLMQPDLVLAGPHAARASVGMLERLGVRVVTFQPARTLADVRDRIAQMGALLGREDRAAEVLADFDTRLQALRQKVQNRPEAALYQANGYTLGARTLAGQILRAAGFDNAAETAGYSTGMRMPLEVLAMTAPDIVITAQRYDGASRSEEVMDHPVVDAFRRRGAAATLTNHDWVCGTPYVLRAIADLGRTRRALQGAAE